MTGDVIVSPDASDALDVLDVSPDDDAADTDGLIDSETDPGTGEVSDPSLCDPSDLEGMVPDKVVNVSEEHRACTSVDDCIAIAINCSHCEGGCTGVQSTCAEAYGALLDCSDYKGPECDYECLPEGGLTVLECLNGLCTVTE